MGAVAERRGLSAASNALRILGQVLDEVEMIGGGKVALVTNEPGLADALASVSVDCCCCCCCLSEYTWGYAVTKQAKLGRPPSSKLSKSCVRQD